MSAKQLQPQTYANCIFMNKKNINGCSILEDGVACDPTKCSWRHTEETYFASLLKAKNSYEKRTGKKDYVEKYVFGMSVREKFRKYLATHAS